MRPPQDSAAGVEDPRLLVEDPVGRAAHDRLPADPLDSRDLRVGALAQSRVEITLELTVQEEERAAAEQRDAARQHERGRERDAVTQVQAGEQTRSSQHVADAAHRLDPLLAPSAVSLRRSRPA